MTFFVMRYIVFEKLYTVVIRAKFLKRAQQIADRAIFPDCKAIFVELLLEFPDDCLEFGISCGPLDTSNKLETERKYYGKE